MMNLRDAATEPWKALGSPLPAGLLLCLLMALMTEKVILKSEDSFREAMVVKMHEVILRALDEVADSNHLDWVLAEARIGSNPESDAADRARAKSETGEPAGVSQISTVAAEAHSEPDIRGGLVIYGGSLVLVQSCTHEPALTFPRFLKR